MKRREYILILAALALFSCQRSDEFDNERSGCLNVSVTEVSSISASSKGAKEALISADTVWVNDSVYLDAVVEDIIAPTPTSRSTPMSSPSQISNLSVVMFKTGSSSWTTGTSRETVLSATKANNSFTLSPNYPWLEGDADRRTLIAVSPTVNSSDRILAANGQSVAVTVPTAAASQTDLCVSNITKNRDIVNAVGSMAHNQPFDMMHVMTAIGFEAAGFDLKIKSITLNNIYSKATLTLHDRTWSSLGTKANYSPLIKDLWLNSDHVQTGDAWRDITADNGYLMMIPQTHADDATITFTFEAKGEQQAGSYTMKLNAIKAAGASTSEWKAGAKVTYRLRLKTNPAVDGNTYAIPEYKAGLLTPAVKIATSTDDNLTFTWTASWLGAYVGTASSVTSPESNGNFTPFQTGVNKFSNIKFFARTENSSAIAERSAIVTVTGTKSGTRTIKVTQPKKATDVVVIFDFLGSQLTPSIITEKRVKLGETFEFPSRAPRLYGYAFYGYCRDKEGKGERYAPEAITTFPASELGTTVTFYPVYKKLVWAGSNIYWDNDTKKLAFAQSGTTDKEKYQGVFFPFGGLVAIRPLEYKYPYPKFSDCCLWSAGNKKYTEGADLPYMDNTISETSSAEYRNILTSFSQSEAQMEASDQGDVCQYMTLKGWAPEGKWRTPTASETSILNENGNKNRGVEIISWGTFKSIYTTWTGEMNSLRAYGQDTPPSYMVIRDVHGKAVTFGMGGIAWVEKRGKQLPSNLYDTGQSQELWTSSRKSEEYAYSIYPYYNSYYKKFYCYSDLNICSIDRNRLGRLLAVRCVRDNTEGMGPMIYKETIIN